MTIAKRQLNRREVLFGGAGLAGGVALAAVMTAPTVTASERANGLEGAWIENVVPDDGSPSHQVLSLYTNGGGVAAITDNPPSSGSTGFGAWESKGEDQFLITFELFTFTPSGQLAGTLRIRALATLDETEDHISGQAHIDFQPAGSPTFFPAGTTHFTGSRITALSL